MKTGSFKTEDGLRIHTVSWAAPIDRQRVVVLAHGISEHSGRYSHVADYLTQAGYHVYALDHRGHGKSEGDRIHVAHYNDFVHDLKQYIDTIKAQHPASQLFILGHSMGSIISLQYVLNYPDDADGLILTGTATAMGSNVSSLLRGAATIIHAIYPQAPIQAPLDEKYFTRDPEMVAQAKQDQLMYKGWTKTSIARYIVEVGEIIQGRAHEIRLPILIMHGEADDITPISGSQIIYEHVTSDDKTLKTWEGMYHEIMNEIGREAVLETVTTWLDAH